MKPAMYLRLLPLAGMLALSMAQAKSVAQKLKALPEAVKKTLFAESPQGSVVTIEPKTMEGAMRYKISVQDHGKSRTLVIEAAGKLLVAKTEVSNDTLPLPVHKTLDAHSQGAKIEKISQVNKSGKNYYEVELQVEGHKKEVVIEPSGELTKVEEVIPLAAVPPLVKSAIEKSASRGKFLKVKSIILSGKLVAYEAAVEVNGIKSEFKLTPEAQPFN